MTDSESSQKLNFTPEQRILLATQLRILQTFSEDEDEQEFYDYYLEVITCGYEQEYDDLWHKLNFYDPFPNSIASEVKEILEMYDDLAKIYQGLNKVDQKSIGVFGFPGFDTNEEIQHYLYTDFLFRSKHPYIFLSRFLNGFCPNSHQQTLEDYRAMLEVWRPWHRNKEQLTNEVFFKIVELQSDTT